MSQPPFGRGFAACDGASVGSVNVAAAATLAGSVPSTPGRAPGGGGGRASLAVAGAAGRACSLGRGRPANGIGAADADWSVLFDFTLKVFTATGWIGSLDPGAARGGAADGDAGRSRCTGTLLALARSKRGASLSPLSGFSDFAGPSAVAVRATATGSVLGASVLGASILAVSTLGVAASAIIDAVRLVEAEAMCSLNSWRMRASRLDALDPPSTTATTWRFSRRIEVTRLKPEAWV